MTEEQFIQTLEALRKQQREADRVSTLFEPLHNEKAVGIIETLHHHSSNQLVMLLQEQMNDTEMAIGCYTWIEWWISENNFGLNGLEAELNGRKITTARELYKALKK